MLAPEEFLPKGPGRSLIAVPPFPTVISAAFVLAIGLGRLLVAALRSPMVPMLVPEGFLPKGPGRVPGAVLLFSAVKSAAFAPETLLPMGPGRPDAALDPREGTGAPVAEPLLPVGPGRVLGRALLSPAV